MAEVRAAEAAEAGREEAGPVPLEQRILALDAPDAWHFVAAGEATLLARRPAAAARPLGRVAAGGLLLGLPPGEETVVAVAAAGTRIYRLPSGAGQEPEPVAALADGVALWLAALAGGLAEALGPSPRLDLALGGAAEAQALPAGAVIGGTGGIVWIELPPPGGLLFGLGAVHGLLPLPAGAWVTLPAAGAVRALAWSGGMARPDWPDAVAAFNAATAELLPLARGLVEAGEAGRLQRRWAAQALGAFHVAEQIADALGNPPPAQRASGGDPLVAALRPIGRALGARIRVPAPMRRLQMELPATLEEIARASDLRLQPVTLADGWWRSESAPMLARRDGQPVALLWRGGHWQAVDHAGNSVRVTATEAAGIAVRAHAVFRPLPPRPGLRGLLRWALAGAWADVPAHLAAVLAGAALGQLLPVASGFAFGVLVPAALQGALLQLGGVILALGIAGFLVQRAGDAARQRIAARADGRLHDGLWDRIAGLPLGVLRGDASAEVAARAAAALAVAAAVRQFGLLASGALAMLASGGAVIAWHSPALAALAAALAALHLAAGLLAGWRQAVAMHDRERMLGAAASALAGYVDGIVALRSAGAEDRALLGWADRLVALRARMTAARRILNAHECWLAAYPVLAAAALFAAIDLANRTPAGAPALPLASVVAVLAAFALMLAAAGQLARGTLTLWLQPAGWSYAQPLLRAAAEAPAGLSDPGPLAGAVEFAAVGFAYPDGPAVLNGVAFRAEPGEMVAVVGSSGAGKSTLVRLLLGLETPSRGAVYIDGHDLRSLHPEAFRRQVGAVLQDERLPPGTIHEIVRGSTEADAGQVWSALAAAALADEVAAMPLGLQTPLPDPARSLSGGQVQRLAMARALLARPAILVLDEATSALDNATQAQVMEAVLRLPATRIVIAHRLSTIRRASRILVLEQGRIVESGGFDALMAQRGRLYKMAEAAGDGAGS